jgi:NAD(P)-dependent dehydrogenase (short-subunit alcohol dehydrogenase family)
MKTLAGKGAVVTGGGQGIGKAIAESLAKAGASVVVAGRTKEKVDGVAKSLSGDGHQAWAAECDVTDPASVRKLADSATGWLGRVDILVNNAGMAHSATVGKQTLDDWNHLLAVNATQAFLPQMLTHHWGRIVNVASVAGLSGARYISGYSASKHAVVGFTRSLAAETAGTGVTANAVCPGYVDTGMTEESINRIVTRTGRSREEALRAILEGAGQRALISPGQVADAVRALCEEGAAATTGEAIVIDGGRARAAFELINPEELGQPRGWTNGILTPAGGRVLFVAGQAAGETSGKIAPGLVEQWQRALEKVITVVQAAGGKPEHIARMTIYVTDKAAYQANLKALGEVHRKLMGRYYPAMALVEVKALVDPKALVEIEATAVLP